MRKILISGLLAASVQAALSIQASATERPARAYLTLEAAQAGIAACLDYARETDLTVAIAVHDRAGKQVAYARMDDVRQKPAELAVLKAEASATTAATTLRLGQAATPETGLESLLLLPGLTGIEGGVPIMLSDDYALGGVGVSGAAPSEDGICAAAAVAAIVGVLET